MTDTDPLAAYLTEVREREQVATPGPWVLEIDYEDSGDDYKPMTPFPYAFKLPVPNVERTLGNYRDNDYLYSEVCELTMGTAEFIAAARTDVSRLLAAVEAAQGLVARWEAKARHLDAAADRIPDSEPGGTLKLVRAQAHEECARALREAVSAALLSEESPGA